MVPDRQKVWTDGRKDGRTDDAKTISLRRGITSTGQIGFHQLFEPSHSDLPSEKKGFRVFLF